MAEQNIKNNAWGDWDQAEVQDTPRMMSVDIFEVDTSHVNPRQTRGENYDSTKESIRNIGLQSILTITRVPGQQRYSLYNGGNTRLAILKELYEEFQHAGDTHKADALRYQTCRYVPWTDDLDSLVKQMAENEERSPMTFIDKARAVFQIKELYLNQFNVDDVSDGKLVRHIHNLGWTKVNRQSVIDLAFAFESLDAVIPMALAAGMGKAKVQQLRQWLGDLVIWLEWLEQSLGQAFTVADGRKLYFQVLAEHDDDISLNLEAFYDDFCLRLGDELVQHDPQWTTMRIRFELEQVREYGQVPEEVPMAELGAQLAATSTLPPPVFPTPRKPREPRVPAANEPGDGGIILTGEAAKSVSAHPAAPADARPHGESDFFSPPQNAPAPSPLSARASNPNVLVRHPALELPDRKLEPEAYLTAVRERSHALIRMLLDEVDPNGVVKELILLDAGADNMLYDIPPCFFIRLEESWQYELLRDWLRQASVPERYAILYLVFLLRFYVEKVYTFEGDDTPDPLTTKQHLAMLWDEFGWEYLQYDLMCNTGYVHAHMRKHPQNILMIMAARLVHDHSGLMYGLETHAGIQLVTNGAGQ